MLLLIAPTLAFTLEETRWPLTVTPTSITAVRWSAGPRLFVLGDAGSVVLDLDGTELLAPAVSGVDTIARDPDGDAVDEAWVCAADGLYAVAEDGSVRSVHLTSCSAIAERGVGVAIVSTFVALWDDNGAGGLTGGEDAGFVQHGPGLLAMADSLAYASVGDTDIQRSSEVGVDTTAAGGSVAGLGVADGVLTWTIAEGALLDAAGNRLELTPGPGAFAYGDVDGDGVVELVVTWADAIGIERGEETRIAAAPVGRPLVADLDGDGCAEVYFLDGAEVVRERVSDCGEDRDTDADGYTPAEGDCDDTDPGARPGGYELCDGVDNDCDGVVEAVDTDAIPARVAVYEGTTIAFDRADEACLSGGSLDWVTAAAGSEVCTPSGGQLMCTGIDDAVETLEVPVIDASGVIATLPLEVTVVNRAPRVDFFESDDGCGDADPFSREEFSVKTGESVDVDLPIDDVPADRVEAFFVDGPSGLTIDAAGRIRWDVGCGEIGTWNTELVVRDDDGGEAVQFYTITVHAGCGGLCSTTFVPFLPLAWAIRRRPRPRLTAPRPSTPPPCSSSSPRSS